jgi:GNAT superfamily N-acetyltransferase
MVLTRRSLELSALDVRRAGLADADAVAAVFIPSFESLAFLPRLHTYDEHRAHIQDRVLQEQEVWLAELDGRVADFAAMRGDVLTHLYVHPELQGGGAGDALLEKAKQRRPNGFTFWVFQQNERARCFYERRGCSLVRLTDGGGNEE